MEEHRVTIRELAARCGYSRATVARALKNDPATNAKTREIVQAWAEKLNYQPDPILSNIGARAWRRPRKMSANLAYLVASQSQTAPHIDERIMEWLGRSGLATGYRLEKIDLDSDPRTPLQLAHQLFQHGIRGLVFSSSVPETRLRQLSLDRFAVLAIGMGHSPALVDVIRRDTVGLDERLWREFLSRGYRRIGYVHVAHPDRPIEEAENLAFYHYLKHGANLGRGVFVCLTAYQPGERFDFRQWIRTKRLEAVAGFNAGVMFDLEKDGIEVPGHVGFGTIRVASAQKQVTGFASGLETICEEAVGQLDKKLRLGQFGLPEEPKRILIRPPWQEGETLPRKVDRS